MTNKKYKENLRSYILIITLKNPACPQIDINSFVTNLDCSLHRAAGSLEWLLHEHIIHHICRHTFLPAHRTADHVYWNQAGA